MEWHKQLARLTRELRHMKDHPDEVRDLPPHLVGTGRR